MFPPDSHPSVLAGVLPATFVDKEGRVFSVRPLHDADRSLLERFYDAFEPKRAAQGLPPQGAARVARWLDTVLPQGTHLLVEDEGGQVVGHAMLLPTDRAGVSEYAIFLDRGVRGRGVGTEVNRVSLEVARTLDLRRLWLSVEPHNRPALRSYEKVGFRFVPGTIFSSEMEMELVL